MADKKISELPVATTPLVGNEKIPIVQFSTTKRTTPDDISAIHQDGTMWVGQEPRRVSTHSAGSVGSGTDSQWELEMTEDVAEGFRIQMQRWIVTPSPSGTPSYLTAYPGPFPVVAGTVSVKDVTDWPTSGTFTVPARFGTGTFSWTGKSGSTGLTGVSSASFTPTSDATARHGFILVDAFGAYIVVMNNILGMIVTDLLSANAFKPTGLTGATAGMRMVGATTSGAPASGTFLVGDVILDKGNHVFMQCTVAGSPGTWVNI